MLSVSEEAGDLLLKMLQEHEASPGDAVRLMPTDAGLDLILDAPTDDDGRFSVKDQLVLIVDRHALELLAGTQLVVDPDADRLTLIRGENPCESEDCATCQVSEPKPQEPPS